ncbi:MAG TPA: WHG domain-containing protein [Bifidobacterium pseudolongum subsp. globosum]|nr:WHG domain-containing protein [Bifidobacterium pseudolongum subsp. globosum]
MGTGERLLRGDHLRASMDSGRWPRYMASVMGYITFAKTEPHLFSMLFMCDQSRDQRERMERQLQPIIELIARQLGMSADTTTAFHMHMWIHVHGIASMIVTHYLDWDEQHIVDTLSVEFHALSASIANQQGTSIANQQGSGGVQ